MVEFNHQNKTEKRGGKVMKRRLISVILAAAMVGGCLAGCGSSDSSESESGENEDGVTTIQWWGGIPEDQGPQDVVDAFNEEHDNIQVEYVRYTNDDAGNTKLDMSLMAGGDADVFISYNDSLLQKRIDAGNCEPLSELLEANSMDMVESFGEGVKNYEFDGEYYMIPTVTDNKCILYNKQMFDDAGVDYPTVGWTYEEFIDAATKLTKDGVYGYYYPGWDAGQPATEFAAAALGGNWIYTEDGSGVDLTKPEIKDSFEKFMERVDQEIEVDFVDNKTQQMSSQDMLLQGKAAMVYGNWITRYINDTETYPHDFVTGFATIPKLSEDQEALYTSSYGDYMSINAKSENKDAAMEFILWYVQGGMEPMIQKAGKLPSYTGFDKETATDLVFGDYADLYDLEEAKNVFITPQDMLIRTNTTAAAEINTVLTEEFELAFSGSQSVDDAIEKAQERAQEQFEAAE